MEPFDKVNLRNSFEGRKIIIDNDCGVDDAWAVSLLVKVSKKPVSHEILGITCANGNTTVDNVCRNNRYLLSKLNRPEIPVFKGASSPLLCSERKSVGSSDLDYFHGRNGFGDVKLPEIKMPDIQAEHAVSALNRLTAANRGKVTIVCLAPLTNIALAIRTYPDFVKNVKEFYIMGGNRNGVGNTTKSAEFNFFSDPEAAYIVLNEAQSKIFLLPWETCLGAQLDFEKRNELSEKCGEIVKFLTTIEQPVLSRQKLLGFPKYTTADQIVAAVLIDPEIIATAFKANATVELSGNCARGQVILDHLKQSKDSLTIIAEVVPEAYYKILTLLKHL